MTFFAKTFVISALFILSFSFSAEIHDAVEAGDINRIQELLDVEPGLIDLLDNNGMTPLCLAAYKAQPEIAAMLIERGADPMIGDIDNSQPLHCCGISGSAAIAEMLLDKGVPVDSRDNNGMTPLHFAASYGKPEVIDLLIDRGADINAMNNQEIWPLLYCVFRADSSMVDHMISKGADLHMKRSNGWIAQHYAAWLGNLGALELLYSRGLTDFNARDNDGATPLLNAARSGNLETIKFMVERGGDVNVMDNNGWTPMHNAAFTNSALVSYFIEQGADPAGGAQSEMKLKPLHIAADICSLSMVRILVENGAPVNVMNDRDQTPLYYAVRGGRQDIVEYLLEKEAAVDTRETFLNRGLLHVSAINGYSGIAKLLIESGADPGICDDQGITPPAYAAYHGFKDLNGAFPVESSCSSANVLLDWSLKPGEAVVWYLGHSGWAVKTANHFLIFDYNFDPRLAEPVGASLASGHVVPAQLKDHAVTSLSTHAHGDHFSPLCFEWQKELPGITYVLGFTPRDSAPEYVRLEPDQSKTVNGIGISAIRSVDAGVAFLLKVDGLVIFYAGDHANANVDMTGRFPKDIDSLKATGAKIDLAFFGITGCSLGDPESVCKGVHYAIEKLKPKAVFPMHGGYRSEQYQAFADDAGKKKYKTRIMCARDRGDAFVYQNGKAAPFPITLAKK